MRIARRAGIQQAASATTPNNSATPKNVNGSVALTPNSSLPSNLVIPNAATSPIASPATVSIDAAPNHQSQHVNRQRAKRHANPEFLRPLRHEIRHHAVDSNRRKQQRQPRKYSKQLRFDARVRIRFHDHLLHLPHVEHRHPESTPAIVRRMFPAMPLPHSRCAP